jgi:hypothetical protein
MMIPNTTKTKLRAIDMSFAGLGLAAALKRLATTRLMPISWAYKKNNMSEVALNSIR